MSSNLQQEPSSQSKNSNSSVNVTFELPFTFMKTHRAQYKLPNTAGRQRPPVTVILSE